MPKSIRTRLSTRLSTRLICAAGKPAQTGTGAGDRVPAANARLTANTGSTGSGSGNGSGCGYSSGC